MEASLKEYMKDIMDNAEVKCSDTFVKSFDEDEYQSYIENHLDRIEGDEDDEYGEYDNFEIPETDKQEMANRIGGAVPLKKTKYMDDFQFVCLFATYRVLCDYELEGVYEEFAEELGYELEEEEE